MEHDASISECRDWEIIGACECFPKRSNGGDLKAHSFSFVRSFSRSGALPDWDVWLSHHCDLHQLLHPLHALRHHRDAPAVCKRKVTQRKSTPVAATNSRSWCCKQEYTQYCRSSSGKDAPWSDKLEFVNGWYILIIVSDTLSIIGSILKIEIQNKVHTLLIQADPCTAQQLGFHPVLLLLLLGRHKLWYLQHLPRNRNHVCVDRSHPLHGLLQEV